MPEKQLADNAILQWASVLFISFLGGITGYMSQIVQQKAKFKFVEFLEKMVVAIFAGIMVAFLCEAANVGFYVRESMVGMAAFLGSETLMLLKTLFKRRVTAMIGAEPTTEQEPGRNG